MYYLSAEFLMGRSLTNAVFNLGLTGPYAEALRSLGFDMETVQEQVRAAWETYAFLTAHDDMPCERPMPDLIASKISTHRNAGA